LFARLLSFFLGFPSPRPPLWFVRPLSFHPPTPPPPPPPPLPPPQEREWSLEDLELQLDIGQTACEGPQDTVVEGLVLEGAAWGSDGPGAAALQLSDALSCPLPPSRLRWRQRTGAAAGDSLRLPLYLNEARGVLVAEVLLSTANAPAVAPHVWAQRGVAVILNRG